LKLSEFRDEKAVEVVAKLLVPIGRIVSNKDNAKARGGSNLEFASAILANNPADVKDMLAILNDKGPSEYHCTAATVIFDVMNMLDDEQLLQLFGLQRQTQTSSTSASESGAESEE
jgi:hypothetical protein